MLLPAPRVGPYLRAFRAGLEAMAPHGDYVPLDEQIALLEALDPACSGALLQPAELDPRSGLPALTWLERARAEQEHARAGDERSDPDDDEIERAHRLDRALGARLEARRSLHRHLRVNQLLPASRLSAVLKRLDSTPLVEIAYDHLTAGSAWERVRIEVRDPSSVNDGGAMKVQGRHRAIEVHPGLRHLLARHAPTPLVALHAQLQEVLGGMVTRLARSRVGPFWFPGIPLPPQAPPALARGLVLQLSSEVVGREVRHSRHLDPWIPPPDGELVPRGCRIYRERRFCASPGLIPVLEAWGQAQGVGVLASPLQPRPSPRRRSL